MDNIWLNSNFKINRLIVNPVSDEPFYLDVELLNGLTRMYSKEISIQVVRNEDGFSAFGFSEPSGITGCIEVDDSYAWLTGQNPYAKDHPCRIFQLEHEGNNLEAIHHDSIEEELNVWYEGVSDTDVATPQEALAAFIRKLNEDFPDA